MKPTEIRVGNTLMSCLTKAPINVDWLVIKHIADGNIQSAYDTSPVYEPIPLTEEILLKCAGLRGNSNVKYKIFKKGECMLYLATGFVDFYHSGHPIKHDIPSLHQLQNLYFALTGEELTITL